MPHKSRTFINQLMLSEKTIGLSENVNCPVSYSKYLKL
jgi:hypothetical protein